MALISQLRAGIASLHDAPWQRHGIERAGHSAAAARGGHVLVRSAGAARPPDPQPVREVSAHTGRSER